MATLWFPTVLHGLYTYSTYLDTYWFRRARSFSTLQANRLEARPRRLVHENVRVATAGEQAPVAGVDDHSTGRSRLPNVG